MGKVNSRILILNWRDIKNPKAGGAEILTHEIAKIWVSYGCTVTQISANFPGAKRREKINGVSVIRMGTWWAVHLLAFLYYFKNLRGKVDIIIDEVHGLPFFAAVYEPKKTILFACEVADKLFFQVFSPPLAQVGMLMERIYLKLYKKTPALVISSSTKKDLIKRGFKQKNITILPMGLTVPQSLKRGKKEGALTLVYLSRINKQKGIEDVIEAFKLINKAIPNSRLWIIGSGVSEYVAEIRDKVRQYNLNSNVKFFGYVDDKVKYYLLSRSHFMIFPSIHEGWGLVITEAGIVGTPSVVYDVAGVRDVVRKGDRGLIVKKRRPDLMAKAIIRYFKNDKLYKALLLKIKSFEEDVGWEETAETAYRVIRQYENYKS